MAIPARKAPDMEEFKALLRKHALKATPQRLAVHAAMMELGHASADMVSEAIAREGKVKITVASVYNILSQLALRGIYHHRLSTNSKMYFDVNTFRHIHLYDTVGNTYRDIEDEELMDMIDAKLARKRFKGYKIEGIDIQILCKPTRKGILKVS